MFYKESVGKGEEKKEYRKMRRRLIHGKKDITRLA